MVGAGGHASVLVDILLSQNKTILGIVAPSKQDSKVLLGLHHYTNDDDILQFSPNEILLVNGIGGMPRTTLRQQVYQKYKSLGYKFATVIANNALLSSFCELAEGVQILNNAVVNTGTEIGENTIVNTSTTVDHDCKIGHHCHLATGVTLSGQVLLGNSVHVGTGANIINSVEIGSNCIIGVGANITKSIAGNTVAYGKRAELQEGIV